MSPDELKGYVDIAVSLLGAGGVGAIILAIIGVKAGKKIEASTAKPEAPTIGPGSMAHLGGLLASEHFSVDLNNNLRLLIEAINRAVTSREAEARQARETADDHRSDMRRFTEAVDTLADRVRKIPGCGA